ncbi:MAG TPA: biosynthetic peptidoglycan transglycosylase [Dehalococcoidia bacterium]|nr:biosynthetic peptidoglycan transglycosylase [Dehalococcoidia bacterium]
MPHGPLRSTGMRRLASALALLLLCAVTAGAAAWAASPTPSALQARVEAWLGKAAGTRVGLGAVPAVLREAVVATEDERFYHHHGIDLIGIVRALPYDITHLTFAQGASTITEQVAKVLYLGGNDHSPWRKLEDAAVAWKLENRYTKSQILAAYLNSAYFGEHAYGIDAASERYFGLPPRRLTAAQASLLAGLIQAPSRYDPYRYPALARSRQAEVLRSLVRTGRLTVSRAASVLARPLRLRSGAVLPAVRGVDLAPGPAFVWWQLLLGAGVIVTACAALVATRLRRARLLPGVVLLRLVLAAAAVVGATAIVRSFRTA